MGYVSKEYLKENAFQLFCYQKDEKGEGVLPVEVDAMPEENVIPVYEAQTLDGIKVRGFYMAFPETTYCFTSDYENHPVRIRHCLCGHRMTDWGLPNEPLIKEVKRETIKLYAWFDMSRDKYGTEPWFHGRGEEDEAAN